MAEFIGNEHDGGGRGGACSSIGIDSGIIGSITIPGGIEIGDWIGKYPHPSFINGGKS